MGKNKKSKIKTIIIAAVGILIVILIGIKMFGGKAIVLGVETSGKIALGVDVSVKDASLSLLGGNVELNDLEIRNPEGYVNDNLMQLHDISARASLRSLIGDPVVINDLRLEGITLVLEQKGLSNNLQEILNKIPKSEKNSADTDKRKSLNIKNLEIADTKVQVKLLPVPGRVKDLQLNLDTIVMKDLGSDSRMDLVELTSRILLAIANGIVKQGGDILPKEITGPMTSLLSESGKVFIEKGKEVLHEGKKAGEKLLDKGKDVGKEVGEALEGLLKSDKKNN